jgi:hypothetical protein
MRLPDAMKRRVSEPTPTAYFRSIHRFIKISPVFRHPVTGAHKYRDLVLQLGGWTQVCKNITAAKSEEVKTGSNLAESSEEGYGSKRALLPMVMNIY